MLVRAVRKNDAEALLPLLDQLGYPATLAEVEQRLRDLNEDSTVLVAVEGEQMIGFVVVGVQRDLVMGTTGQILGLVVADGFRSNGAGAQLLAAAERWAFERGTPSVTVHSNVVRERAHRFYEREGYERIKAQGVFVKRKRAGPPR